MFSPRQSVLAIVALSISVVSAFTGPATFYDPNGLIGACGNPLQNSDLIVALSISQYAGGAHCGTQISVSYAGNSVSATVADECPTCAGDGIDLSPAAFQQLASLDAGEIQVTWDFE
ncbi:RlpA-like double-psi beta-barrel-protein domain-containing protein-containing protein [Desarmillaria tabescens]|uniref:RlpA-like double-psi beta-barrel-protein domain-containing protein-containing protein n=1 Tax=Armillaria tabescens TaxID=1929756 RepID=A0AA39K9Z9_ARMTA|nr:RlpA-like double-psi beta-barrel-protein domain-containing protein-containing protein [Desarmillaria tabescens]KAK0457326.1 RlpA-like double-psi beta-barrel-protein domain-containing protein-containing protein [Desarmillaria tabescens]